MVGGRVIEVKPHRLESGRDVIRLWCVDGWDECAVYSEPYAPDDGPKIGENIWWQSGQIMFDGDKRTVRKVGFSFDPRQ